MVESASSLMQAIVELQCSDCKLTWNKRQSSEGLDLLTLASHEEVEHSLAARCFGSVSVREVGYHSGYVASELHRCSIDVERFLRFRAACSGEIEARAVILDKSMDVVAAAMFMERERQVEQERLSLPKDTVVGLGSTSVSGNSGGNITVQSQVIFRPERLEVPDCIVQDFFLTDIKVGKNSQMVSPGAIPMSLFVDHRHRFLKLKMDVAQIAQFITVSVVNTNPNTRNFFGALVGRGLFDADRVR